MEHSDELTFADYFNAEKEIYRNITCAALAARWLLDHGFVMPTDAEIKRAGGRGKPQSAGSMGRNLRACHAEMAGRPITPGRLRIVTCCWI